MMAFPFIRRLLPAAFLPASLLVCRPGPTALLALYKTDEKTGALVRQSLGVEHEASLLHTRASDTQVLIYGNIHFFGF